MKKNQKRNGWIKKKRITTLRNEETSEEKRVDKKENKENNKK